MRITVLQEIAPLLCMSLATGAGKSRQLGAEPGLPMEAYGAGRFLGEWQTMPAALSGPLSRRTFLSQAAQAGLAATQLSATWLAGSNAVAAAWFRSLVPKPQPSGFCVSGH